MMLVVQVPFLLRKMRMKRKGKITWAKYFLLPPRLCFLYSFIIKVLPEGPRHFSSSVSLSPPTPKEEVVPG